MQHLFTFEALQCNISTIFPRLRDFFYPKYYLTPLQKYLTFLCKKAYCKISNFMIYKQ
jgi:hypothetical protein